MVLPMADSLSGEVSDFYHMLVVTIWDTKTFRYEDHKCYPVAGNPFSKQLLNLIGMYTTISIFTYRKRTVAFQKGKNILSVCR
jgi:hypothetical protein